MRLRYNKFISSVGWVFGHIVVLCDIWKWRFQNLTIENLSIAYLPPLELCLFTYFLTMSKWAKQIGTSLHQSGFGNYKGIVYIWLFPWHKWRNKNIKARRFRHQNLNLKYSNIIFCVKIISTKQIYEIKFRYNTQTVMNITFAKHRVYLLYW